VWRGIWWLKGFHLFESEDDALMCWVAPSPRNSMEETQVLMNNPYDKDGGKKEAA
jgi:hypothetical protein